MKKDIFGFRANPQKNFLPDRPTRNFRRKRRFVPREAVASAVNPAPRRRRFLGFSDDPNAPDSQPYLVSGASFAAQSGAPDDAFEQGGVGGLLDALANQPDAPQPSGGSSMGSGSSGLASSALQGASKGRKRKPKRKFSRMSGRDECGFVNACGCA